MQNVEPKIIRINFKSHRVHLKSISSNQMYTRVSLLVCSDNELLRCQYKRGLVIGTFSVSRYKYSVPITKYVRINFVPIVNRQTGWGSHYVYCTDKKALKYMNSKN